jgi:hypothetical protein
MQDSDVGIWNEREGIQKPVYIRCDGVISEKDLPE